MAGLNFHKLGNRQAAWFGPTDYCYSSYTHPKNNKWPSILEQLRLQLCNDFNLDFTSCLVNFYPDGMSGVGWHSDDEKIIVPESPIASLSLGCSRQFQVRSISTGATYSYNLSDGMLMIMQGEFQKEFMHRVTVDSAIIHTRINITFRKTT